MQRRDWLAAAATSAALAMVPGLARASQPATPKAEPPAKPLPPPRANGLLRRGVNLSHWLWLPQEQDAAKRWSFVTREELTRLRDAGLSHVRLPIDPAALWDQKAMRVRAGAWGEAVRAVETCLEAGLGVIVDVHPLGGRSAWIMPEKEGATPHLEGLWQEIAPLCGVWSHDEIVLDIMNEPHEIEKPEFWHAAQRRVHKIIRGACPQHTILATGDQWGGVDGLLALPALDDANVVYSFHFYEPMTFTHQGATWGWEGWKDLKDVEYPLACARAREIAKKFAGSQGAKGLIGEHCNGEEAVKHGGWNSQRIAARIDRAVAWAKTNARSGVPLPLYCGEFGVYRAFAPAPSRANWIRDVRLVLEERGIGWAMWDYVGGFALTKESTREADPAIAQALGMR